MKNNVLLLLLFATVILLFGACASRRTTLQHPDYGKHKDNTVRPSGASSSPSLAYIEQYKDIAIAEMNAYGIPASIKLAQALLESGNGNSYLARQANNHFGIKCGGAWKGKSISRPDDRARDCFRVYKNPEESFRDHSQFLLRERYSKLFDLNMDDYKGWAKGLREAGYATNPRYPQLLINLIERYQLYQYDHAEASYGRQEKREEKINEIIHEKETARSIVSPEPEILKEPKAEPQSRERKNPLAMIIYEVKASDTLYAISQREGVSVERIKQLNDLSSDELSEGQLLVISK